jgi:DNA-binding MarR family transcriptional regulator
VAQRDWFPEAALLQEVYSAGVLAALLVDGELDKAGVSTRHFSFLGWVGVLEPVTPRALSAETGMPPTTIRDYVRALIASGDLRKSPNPDDGRSYLLELTAKGRARMEAGYPSLRAAYEQLRPHLPRSPDEHRREAGELRGALRAALRAAQRDGELRGMRLARGGRA